MHSDTLGMARLRSTSHLRVWQGMTCLLTVSGTSRGEPGMGPSWREGLQAFEQLRPCKVAEWPGVGIRRSVQADADKGVGKDMGS